MDRWGRGINRTTIGPMEEGDDVILSCRVVGGKYMQTRSESAEIYNPCS